MISFIIPAYNEEKYIEKTLLSIPDKFEKIVVCNGCTDQTYNIAKKHARVINIGERNVSKARNLGALEARNNLLVFLDADTRISKGAYNDLIKIRNVNVVGTFKSKFNKNNIFNFIYSNIKNIFPYFKIHNSSGAVFCSKFAFEKSGGFKENKNKGENHDFVNRAEKYAGYYFSKSYVITSARRFEKIGYIRNVLFWIKEYLIGNKDYPIIR